MMSTLSQQVREAREFADQTTRTIRTVYESAPDCIVDESTKGNVWRATIAPPNNKPAPLTVNGAQILKLLVNYECTSSPRHSHMLIETSRFILLPKDANEPLMRMEYMRHPRSSVPSFHMHMHAHRDAWTFTMCRDGVGSSRKKFINAEARSESHSFPTSISRSVGRACDRPSKTSLRCLYTILALTTPMTHSKYLKSSASAGASRKCRRLQNQCRTS